MASEFIPTYSFYSFKVCNKDTINFETTVLKAITQPNPQSLQLTIIL